MNYLFLLSFFLFNMWTLNCFGQAIKLLNPITYDEKKVPSYVLPEVLLCKDGSMVATRKKWENERRQELLDFFSTYVYGKVPQIKESLKWEIVRTDYSALGGRAIRREIKIWPLKSNNEYFLNVQMYLPLSAKDEPVPLFLAIALLPNYTVCSDPDVPMPDSILIADGKRVKAYRRGEKVDFWQLEMILSKGYGLATFCHQDFTPDTEKDFVNGFPSLFYRPGQYYPYPDEWGAISMWAWQMSRVLDYVLTDKMIDSKKVIAIGHSRLGKTALWAAVQDQRFAMAVSNNSGCGGAAISKRCYGETVEAINRQYPQWFCGNFKQFNNREKYLPVDQHELIALMAPRPVYVASAEEDRWADPKGEFIGAKEASSAYHLYGLNGLECDAMPALNSPVLDGYIGYHYRKGKHTITAFDWDQYLKFADRHFKKTSK